MATIPELLDGHITLEVECLDRLCLNGYIGKLATGPGLMMFMRGQLGKPAPSPVVLGQVSEKFREAVKTLADRDQVPIHQFRRRPDRVQSIFDRVVTKKTPGEFRTRVIQDGVHPSLHINKKTCAKRRRLRQVRGHRRQELAAGALR